VDFNYTSEQEMLKNSLRAYMDDRHDFASRRKRLSGELDSDDWAQLADLGITAVGLPQEAGGVGGPEEIVIIAEEMGRSLALVPYVAGAVFAPKLLEAFAETRWKTAMQAGVAEGHVRLAVALDEKHARFEPAKVRARADRGGDGSFVLTGRKLQVLGGAQATHVIVVAQYYDDAAGSDVVGLFLLGADAAGVTRHDYELADDSLASDYCFVRAPVEAECAQVQHGIALAALSRASDYAILASCADALGAMDRATDLTAEYMKNRKQFGRTLAEFQVLQHGVSEMFIASETARSLVYRAIAALDGPPGDRRRAVSACKVKVMTSGKWVTGQAIHQHGGIGLTMEYAVGHCHRRLMVLEKLLGDTEFHLRRYVEQ
jgi:acyl-CoA dehydrogenase